MEHSEFVLLPISVRSKPRRYNQTRVFGYNQVVNKVSFLPPDPSQLPHFRTLIILWRLLPIGVSFRRDFRRWIFFGGGVARTEAFHGRRAKWLVDSLVSLGPT